VIVRVNNYIETIEATLLGIIYCASVNLKADSLNLDTLKLELKKLRKSGLDPSTVRGFKLRNLGKPSKILKWLLNVSDGLSRFDEEIAKHVQWAVAYADRTLNEQLSFEQSRQTAKFDVAELAHVLRIVTRFGQGVDFRLIKLTLETVCKWQRDDGRWPATRPFVFLPSGFTAHPHSIEIAWAVVSIMRAVADNVDRFGMSNQEIAVQLAPAYRALEKHFQWLNGASVRFRLPARLETEWPPSRKIERPNHVFGWCSDRTPQAGTVHPWVTANAIEFLVECRDLLQQRVNDAIRDRFQSYHPRSLTELSLAGLPPRLGPRRR
jgi:hypothetical protein